MTRPSWWFRVLVRALPRAFRDEYRGEMLGHVEWMETLYPGRAGRVRLWFRVTKDILTVAVAERGQRLAGVAAMTGGILALAVTPLLVIVKYSTGWNIIPAPAWEGLVRPAVEPLVTFATPVQLWIVYGSIYTLALVLMYAGVWALRARVMPAPSWLAKVSLWVLLGALSLVIVGDAIHTATWHLGGATVPRPRINAAASLGISMSYLGIPLVFVSSFILGGTALRARFLPRTIAILLLAVAPGGMFLTATQIPAMPSGSLSVFAVMMTVWGASVCSTRSPDPRGRTPRAS
jgi:hypothetical protein